MDVYFRFLGNLVFGNDIEICKRFMKKGCDITCLLKYFGICVVVDELEQLIENSFNPFNLLIIRINKTSFGHEFLFFFLIPFLKL